MSLLWSFSIFDCKALNVYVADGEQRHRRWVDFPHGVTLQTNGKACPLELYSQVTYARCKMLSSETADSSAARCYCRCKEWRSTSVDFSDLYLIEKKASSIASSAWLKKSSKRSSFNWYLIRDQSGHFIPASNIKSLQSNALVALWEPCIWATVCQSATQSHQHWVLLGEFNSLPFFTILSK